MIFTVYFDQEKQSKGSDHADNNHVISILKQQNKINIP